MMGVEYRGLRAGALGVLVQVGELEGARFVGRDLPLRLDLVRLSPEGFDWGHSGRGPAQLAVAILADALGTPAGPHRERIIDLADQLKWAVVAHLPDSWRISQEMLGRWVSATPGKERATVAALIVRQAQV